MPDPVPHETMSSSYEPHVSCSRTPSNGWTARVSTSMTSTSPSGTSSRWRNTGPSSPRSSNGRWATYRPIIPSPAPRRSSLAWPSARCHASSTVRSCSGRTRDPTSKPARSDRSLVTLPWSGANVLVRTSARVVRRSRWRRVPSPEVRARGDGATPPHRGGRLPAWRHAAVRISACARVRASAGRRSFGLSRCSKRTAGSPVNTASART